MIYTSDFKFFTLQSAAIICTVISAIPINNSMSILRWHQRAVNCQLSFLKIGSLINKFGPEWRLTGVFGNTAAVRQSSNIDEALCINEAPALDPEWATADCEKLEALERSSGKIRIDVEYPECVATTNGVPDGLRCSNALYIRRSVKYATMSGTDHTHHWEASWEPGKNWMNPLMGWTSSSDPEASLAPLRFSDEASAVKFCEKNGYNWYKQRDPPSLRNPIVRRYENNFHWNRRSRLSTR